MGETEQTALDVPDGLQVDRVPGDKGSLQFYTGRFPVQYDADDVRELVRALQAWLDE